MRLLPPPSYAFYLQYNELLLTIQAESARKAYSAKINALFAVLVILGIVVDPTTDGLGDSERAMAYEEPWADKEKE